jgi:hypothetical protein
VAGAARPGVPGWGPEPVAAVAVRLAAIEAGATGLLPRLRLRTRSGRWAILQWLHADLTILPGWPRSPRRRRCRWPRRRLQTLR